MNTNLAYIDTLVTAARCPVHEIIDGFTCPVKPCKYVGLSGRKLKRRIRQALKAGARLQVALDGLYGDLWDTIYWRQEARRLP